MPDGINHERFNRSTATSTAPSTAPSIAATTAAVATAATAATATATATTPHYYFITIITIYSNISLY